MAVTLGDAAILVVDAQLRPLVAAHLPALIDGLALGVEMRRGAIRPPRLTSQPPAGLGTT